MPFLYDFYCSKCKQTFEAFAKMKEMQKECPGCGAKAGRSLSVPHFKLDGTDPAYSTAWDKWAKQHEDAAKRAYKRDDLGGKYHGDN